MKVSPPARHTLVHLVRHGEVFNPTGVLYGRLPDFHLSDNGRAMATRLGEYFAEVELTALRCSPLDRAQQTLAETGVSPDVRVRDLTDDDLVKLRDWIEANYRIEGDLRREVAADIRRKIEIGCYQGIRHRRGLPVRGQRTHTNARGRKGPRKTVAGKKKAGKK